MKKLFVKFKIIEIADNTKRVPRLGKGFNEAIRFNRWNPIKSHNYNFVGYGAALGAAEGVKEVVSAKPFKWY